MSAPAMKAFGPRPVMTTTPDFDEFVFAPLERRVQVGQDLGVQRIQLLRAVDREDGDPVGDFGSNEGIIGTPQRERVSSALGP